MTRKKELRIAVVGAGVSGLAAAHRILEQHPAVEVTVIEATGRPGGALFTEECDGFVIERGPDSILAEKPAVQAWAEQLSIADELVGTNPAYQGAYVVCRGKLERIPAGFSLVAPLQAMPFLRSPILSWRGKLRAGLDLVLPRGGPVAEESLEHFVTRRFGRELFQRLAQPLVGGIYGADPERLSLDATMPRFREAERSSRSVILGLRKRQREAARRGEQAVAHGARYGMFVSFKTGLGRLPERAAELLAGRVRYRVTTESVVRNSDGSFELNTTDGRVRADGVILALPAPVVAELLRSTDVEVATLLDTLEFGSAATVTLAYRSEQIRHPLDAYGYLVPAVEQRPTLAATWMSRKWPGRAPAGKELIRVFVGGHHNPQTVDWGDDQLIEAAERDLAELLGARGSPELVRVDRWPLRMPQYVIGHRQRVRELETAVQRLGAIRLAGNSYRGVGIPDAIVRGRAMADDVLAVLHRGSAHPAPKAVLGDVP